ncbi:DcrB-related protein [Hyalangium sp.]|uniref:DcrB-related protein n=1 Tax=Hyalangium sp. TaxID=2028555 RepID=UPI002D32A9FF|nr:DcrB-related protein [Hyalangium sp.]HYH95975.1 DcrB-related protein [Hyalangium sp.]
MSSRTMQYGSLQMSLPEGWSDATQIVASGPVEEGFRSTLGYTTEAVRPRETPPQFAARMLAQLRHTQEGLQLVSERPATFGALGGFLRETTHVAHGMKLAQLHFYVAKAGVVHIFTFTQRAERLQASRAMAEKLFASATLSAPAAAPGAPSATLPPALRPRPKYIEPRHLRIIAA